jgi:hypothetical protein
MRFLTRARLTVGEHCGIAAAEDRIDQRCCCMTIDEISRRSLVERVIESERKASSIVELVVRRASCVVT